MKKLLVAALALISFTGINQAQAQKGLSISVKGSPQLSWMNNEDDNDNNALDMKPLFSSSFGIGIGYNFTRNFGVAVDALYSMQGRKYETNDNDFYQKVNYIKVAPVFTYTTNPIGIVSFVGKLGPQVNFLTDSKLTNDDGDKVIGDMNKMYEKVTFGGVSNLGAQFQLSKKVFLTSGVRFDMDFTNAENEDHVNYPNGREITLNSSFGLEFGVKFKL
jgi:hypothetical protein